jgi:hypothetical protein
MSSSGTPSSTTTLIGMPSSSDLISNVAPTIVNPFYMRNVKSHVPITLKLNRPNFTCWSTFFKAMVEKFGLLYFLDPAILERPTDPMWEQTDYAIKGWLYTSVDDSVLVLTMDLALTMDDDDQTICSLYATIFDLFNDNKEACSVHLSNEFHTLVQGDSSIINYCQRVKIIIDSLHNAGHAVSET